MEFNSLEFLRNSVEEEFNAELDACRKTRNKRKAKRKKLREAKKKKS